MKKSFLWFDKLTTNGDIFMFLVLVPIALSLLSRQGRKRVRPKTLGADKGYHASDFGSDCVAGRSSPTLPGWRVAGLRAWMVETTRHGGYVLSQKIRKRVEEIFGWMKTVGGLRKTRFRGIERTQQYAHMVGAAYNLLRMSRLIPKMAVP